MTDSPTPNTPLTADDVKLLRKGDWLLCIKGISDEPSIATGQAVTFDRPSGTGGVSNCIVTSADDSFGYRPNRFHFLGRPDQSGWIAHDGGLNPAPGLRVDIKTSVEVIEGSPSYSLFWDLVAHWRPHVPAPAGEMCRPCSMGFKACDCQEANLTASNAELLDQALSHPPLEAPAGEGDDTLHVGIDVSRDGADAMAYFLMSAPPQPKGEVEAAVENVWRLWNEWGDDPERCGTADQNIEFEKALRAALTATQAREARAVEALDQAKTALQYARSRMQEHDRAVVDQALATLKEQPDEHP